MGDNLVDRFATRFSDRRHAELIKHEVKTLVGQLVLASPLAVKISNDQDDLSVDWTIAVAFGQFSAGRSDRGLGVPPWIGSGLISNRGGRASEEVRISASQIYGLG